MNFRSPVIFLIALVLPSIGRCQTHSYEFVKEIGVGWQRDTYGWMSFVSFSPDGQLVASDGPDAPGDSSGNLRLWSFPDGKLIKQFPFQVTDLSSDWKYFANAHGVGELATGKLLVKLGGEVYGAHAFSLDSRYVAESPFSGRRGGASIRVLELPSGEEVGSFGKRHVFSIAMSPDGTTLASGYWGIVVLWDFRTGKRLATLRGFDRYVIGLAFSKSGDLLAAGTDIGVVQIWDVHRSAKLRSLAIGGGDVSRPTFTPDGRLLAVGIYGTGTTYLINVESGEIVDHKKVSDLGCGSVAFSPDGQFLITPSTGGLIKWPYDRGGTIRVFKLADR